MRNRHIPRVCRDCQAPLASGAASCWRCGVAWATEEQPPTTLRLVPSAPPASDPLPAEVTALQAAEAGARA
jgi:predicted amidophosphoribosyltransferase